MKKEKVAFLSRVSTLEQHSSIENQDLIFDQWLQNNPNCELYKVYTDEGISGSKSYKRPEFLQMLEDGRHRKYDILVAKSYSRFARNQRESLSAIADLRVAGVRVIFLEESMDTDKDIKNAGLYGWLAEMEAQKTSERIKTVWDSFNREGKVHVTLAPYGYFYDKEIKNFLVNEVEANTIKRIFTLYLEGCGFNNIANVLDSEGITTKRGGKWAGATIRGILTNEFYVGTLVQGKSRTLDVTLKQSRPIPQEEWFRHQNNHEALIDIEVFKKVNKQIEERSYKAKKSYTKEHSNISRNSNKSLFSNLLICGECNKSMVIKRKKKDNYKPYYQCLDYDRRSLKSGHSSNRINESTLVNILKKRLTKISDNNFKELEEVIANKKASKDNLKIEKELKAIESKIDSQINIANTLLTNYVNGKISELQYSLQNDSLGKSLNSLVDRKKTLEELLQQDTTKEQKKVIFQGIESILGKPVEEWNNSELKEIIESITIFIDGTIKIKVKYFG